MGAVLFSLAVSVVVFVLAEINRNYSQVDRIWSMLPVVYATHYAVWAHANGIPSERVDTLATFVALWGVRAITRALRRCSLLTSMSHRCV